jgi:hypothetical protein
VRNPHVTTGGTAPIQSMTSSPPMGYHPAPLTPTEQVANGSSNRGGGCDPGSYQLPRPYQHQP